MIAPSDALGNARLLRELRLSLCLTPTDESGVIRADSWSLVSGRSGRTAAFQMTVPAKVTLSQSLPATWTIRGPGVEFRIYALPEAMPEELLIGPTAFGVTVVRLVPLPGTINADSGQRYEWDPLLHPATLAKPSPLPMDFWRALPKQKFDYRSNRIGTYYA